MAVNVLNVAEKPSAAKEIAQILSHGDCRSLSGHSVYNRIFHFNYMIGGQPCRMVMTSVSGHLMELDFEEQFRKWYYCDPADLFQAPVRRYVPQDKLGIKRTLEEQARNCQWLVLWLDCDREGENIAYEVVEVCLNVNRGLNVLRARFSAFIEREIQHAAQNLHRPNRNLSDAVDARQEIDLRIGASFTRFQTMLLKDRFVLPFDEHEKAILSYGPCQFPTLGFVVERYWQVQAHQPEDFWTINCVYRSENDSASFKWARGHLFDYVAAVAIYEMCVEEPLATVFSVTGRETRKNPPHPLNTVELVKRASRFLRLGSQETMKAAEELYQQGFISYPRTETDYFSENTDLRRMVEEQTRHPVWGNYAHRLLDSRENLWRHPSNGGHDDKAHPPIHPTRFSDGEPQWRNDHKAVYELVVRHFLACVSQPAVGYATKAMIDIAGEQFSANGLMVTARNYLEVYRYENWAASTLPNFDLGQQFIPTRLTLDAGRTQPPPLLSEADLIALMDKEGIGTDATMHDHIKKLLDRRYATKDAQTRFCPTNLGEALVMGYDTMGYELWKPHLRSIMERDMKAVGDGIKVKENVLETCLQQMKTCFLDVGFKAFQLLLYFLIFLIFSRLESQNQVPEAVQVGGIVRRCPMCREADMVLKRRPDSKFMVGCRNFPQCKNVVWLPSVVMEATVTTHTCNSCIPAPVYKIDFKFKRAEIPPQYSIYHTGCVGGCDIVLNDIMNIYRAPPAPSGSNFAFLARLTETLCRERTSTGSSFWTWPWCCLSKTRPPWWRCWEIPKPKPAW
ncbi:hypothetical protein SELMODRAFT_121488 [Selaginella moellendorffii]|uniref:DNA topoisomerase n=1 Tax=Selaginella moellendorffii TaxID=88036 RepID=D8SP39_SELML|nr:hypothetical protein SELMODRAFT_121488 [Selaginella moellendorffii]